MAGTTTASVHGDHPDWPLNRVVAAITNLGDQIHNIATSNGDAQAIKTRCPVHGRPEGGHDSIRVTEMADGAVKIWCYSQCRYRDVLDAWGLTPVDLRTGPDGTLLERPWIDPYRGTDDGNADLLVKWYGDELLYGRGIGWMMWDSRRWAENEEAALGVCRQASARLYKMAAEERDDDRRKKYFALAVKLGDTGPVKRAMEFARTDRLVEGHQLDADPDLLNTPAGVVDLRTGNVTAHDPELLQTKITSGSYRPGYTHPDWQQALEALPEDVRDWFQARIGQALTGHADPHGQLIIAQGAGENGKSGIFGSGIVKAFGDYATTASPKLLLSAKDEHSTEKTELRGRRLVLAEEMTEGRSINVTSLKQIQDVEDITARRLYRNNVSFKTSHTLFASSNYTPIVNETDHGTWRRLALLRFPYTFRKPGEDLLTELCRAGDPGLKPRLSAGRDGQHDAIITWAVEGAIRWYQDPTVLNLPKRVADDTAEWRAEADRILGFWREWLRGDRAAAVLKDELRDAFNRWVQGNGHNAWAKETFHPRFAQHHETSRHGVVEARTRSLNSTTLSRAPADLVESLSEVPKLPYVYRGVRFKNDIDDTPEHTSAEPETPPPTRDVPTVPTFPELFREEPISESLKKVGTVGTPQAFTLVNDVSTLEPSLEAVRASGTVGLDLETTGLDPHTSAIRLCQIATERDEIFIFDCNAVPVETVAGAFIDRAEIVGQNLKFELRFLRSAGIDLPDDIGSRLWDTMLVSQLLGAGDRTLKHNLAAIAHRYVGVDLDKDLQKSDWSGDLTDAQLRYAALDVAHLLDIQDAQNKDLIEANLTGVTATIEHPCLPALAWLEHSGMPFDREAHTALVAETVRQRVDAETKLKDAAGREINWGSWQQVKALLAERGHDVPNTSETTLLAVDDDVARLLIDYRHARKREGIYGGPFANAINPVTGRVHADFRQIGSHAGRMSCRDPNLQQVPKYGGFRAMFRAPQGRVLVRCDYSQIELRVAAQLAPDDKLIAALRSGEDLHEATARLVLGKDEVTAEDRKAAKALNFGLLYGMGATKLRRYAHDTYGVDMTQEEAEVYKRRFFDTYSGLRAWHRRQPEGPVVTRTVTGRRRVDVDQFTFKVNTPVQGAAADGMKLALALLYERQGPAGAFPVNVVHDEIVVECGWGDVKTTREWVESAMRDGMAQVLTEVPVVVETTVSERWGE